MTLNTVAWQIAMAIGAVSVGATRVEDRNVLDDLDTLLVPGSVASFPARPSDPGTSDAAASRKSTTDVGRFSARSQQARLLGSIAERPRTAQGAAISLDGNSTTYVSRLEGARRRVSDLLRAGYVADSGRRRKNPGSPDESIVWEITPAGRIALVNLEADGWSK